MVKTADILKLNQRELQKLTEKELRQVVSVLRSTSRKRYERLERSDVYSEAATTLWKSSAGRGEVLPTVAGMDETQLLNEFKRYRKFLLSKTSTVSGARKSQKNKKEIVSDITGVEMDADDLRKFYSIYDEAKDSGVGGVLNYKQVMETVAEVYDTHPEWDSKTILNEVKNRLQEVYEEENSPDAIYPSSLM